MAREHHTSYLVDWQIGSMYQDLRSGYVMWLTMYSENIQKQSTFIIFNSYLFSFVTLFCKQRIITNEIYF